MSLCTSMRQRMLEAEPYELRGEGTSAIARHVRTCVACRAIGGTLAADTAALARLLAAGPVCDPSSEAGTPAWIRRPLHPPGRASRAAFALLLPLAAAIALMLLSQPERDGPPAPTASGGAAGSGATSSSMTMSAGAQRSGEATQPATASAPAAAKSTPPAPDMSGATHTVAGVAIASLATSGAPLDERGSTGSPPAEWDGRETPPSTLARDAVHITPTAGSRAVVMRTRNPAVTVVWLQ